jgi:Arylsulfotransferase (ASST)/Carbohydrate binding module (family 35)/Protein of unknown function (DUF642)
MVIVLNQNFQVSWVWNAFDWLPTSRLPTLPSDTVTANGITYIDWTHCNSISWSPEDGNLIVSVRDQDWVVKIDYANGTGDGHVIWTLGQGGSFTLIAPPSVQSPWFSHQHDVTYVDDNTIILFDDGNTRHYTDPTAQSRGQEYVINEQTMTATLVFSVNLGNYSAAVGSAQLLPNGNFVFTSGLQGTEPNVIGQSIEVLPNGTEAYVLQMSGIEYRSYFMSNLYGTPANILNAGFEYPIQGTGNFAYQPTGSAWSFSVGAGVAGNDSGFTSGNPNAPQGSQVGFLQGDGATISQAVNFSAAGTYQISFSAAQRGNYGTSDEEVNVLVDGTVVSTITPASTGYATYTTASFTVTAGSHTISFVGVDPTGADYTALLDQISIFNAPPMGFTDPGFENPSEGAGNFAYRPAGSAWSFSVGAGLAGNGSSFTSGNPNAPQGSQVAFLQGNGATISQVVDFPVAGSYLISFSAAQRGNYGTSDEEVDVLVNGTVVSTITPASTSYAMYTTASFTVTAGKHTISFVGVDPTGADYTAFLDQASIVNTPATGFTDPGFETPSEGSCSFAYQPTGSAWSFSTGAGLAGNDSGFTRGNPNAPQGSQVAFLQGNGATISQVVNFSAAGSYLISVSAAQRGNFHTSNQEVEVLVDGTVVAVFTPTGTSYATYTTASFNVTAGNHTISFVSVDPTGADYTALLDQASINYVSPAGFTDPTFENPSEGTGNFAYRPTGSAWSFSGNAGLAGNDSGFTAGNSNAPEGSQVAFIQAASGKISQVVDFSTTGSYQISFSAAQRANNGTSDEEIDVLVDGTVVSTITPAGTSYALYATASFDVTAGSHTISFVAVDPTAADYTAFIDGVTILQVG